MTGQPEDSNSPFVENEAGEDVNVEEWDPMPDELREAEDVDEADHTDDPMEGPAPTG